MRYILFFLLGERGIYTMKINMKKGVNAIITVIATLGLATISIAVYAIVVSAFRDSQVAGSLPYNITNDGLNLFSGLTSQFSTIGTVSGVLLLVAVMALFGIGGYMAYQGMAGGKR